MVCLVLGLLAVAVVAGSQRLVPGAASPATRLVAPAVGSCLTVASDDPGDAGDPRRIAAVDCSAWHQVDVASAARRPLSPEDCRAQSDPDAFAVPRWPRRWVPLQVRMAATALLDPASTADDAAVSALAPGLRPWAVCVRFAVVPELGLSTEFRTAADGTTQPRWCLDRRRQITGCDQPHAGERLGVAGISAGDVAAPGDCGAFAAQLIGVGDSLTATPLDERVVIVSVRDDGRTRTTEPSAVVACDVWAPSGRSLVGSVIGHGTAPIELR